jgi:hypothetical protein
MTEDKTPSAKAAAARRRRNQAAHAAPAAGSGQAQTAVIKAETTVAAHVIAPIEGKVAAIINELDLAINRGARDGVERGMRFEVLDPDGVEITDPDTGERLGEETAVKIVVKVTRAEDDYSVARSDERIPGTMGFDSLFAASRFLKQQSRPARPRTLRTDEAIFNPSLKEEKSYVKRGDPVRQLLD